MNASTPIRPSPSHVWGWNEGDRFAHRYPVDVHGKLREMPRSSCGRYPDDDPAITSEEAGPRRCKNCLRVAGTLGGTR